MWFSEGDNFEYYQLPRLTKHKLIQLNKLFSGERNTSTALACLTANLGGLLPALAGPKMVTDPVKDPSVSKDQIANEIYMYMLMYFILSIILFAMLLIYFPDNEETQSEEERSQNIFQDLSEIFM